MEEIAGLKMWNGFEFMCESIGLKFSVILIMSIGVLCFLIFMGPNIR